jgi:hypothetical protein
MVGDRADMLARLRAVLPARWFPDAAPVLDALLSGAAAVWEAAYAQLQFVRAQTRIATASGLFLDLVAADFFGMRLRRKVGQDDDSLRRAIGLELLRERGTRGTLQGILADLTGRMPVIFEPTRPADTRGWGIACGWGVAGGWGSLSMPFQCLVTAFRPQGGGVSQVTGWGGTAGSWGGGTISYASLSMLGARVSDEEIAAAVTGVMPVATIAWMRISN